MKTLKQIENQLKAAGLTGDAFKDEFHRQALVFGRQLLDEMFVGYGMENYDFQDAAVCTAHIAEIFIYAQSGEFYHDFAEHFQREVFNASHWHTRAFCDWHDKTFDAPESETEQPKPANDLEIENTALLISGLLNNPNVPVPIFNAIQGTVGEMFNASPQSVRHSIDNSPEYIAMVLHGYEQAEVKK